MLKPDMDKDTDTDMDTFNELCPIVYVAAVVLGMTDIIILTMKGMESKHKWD